MKKIIILLSLAIVITFSINAQSLITNVPVNANIVMKYSGENFKSLMPLKKVNSYAFIKDNLFKMLDADTLTSVENMGVDFLQDSYQYIVSEDSALSFVTLVNLTNATQFQHFFKKAIKTTNKVEQKNGYSFLSISDNTYASWSNNKAVIVNTTHQFKRSYWDYKYASDTTASIGVKEISPMEEVAADPPVAIEVAPPPVIKKDGYKSPKKKTITTKGKTITKSKTTKKPVTTTKKKPEVIEDILEDKVMEVAPYYESEEEKAENKKRELWEQQEDARVKKIQRAAAENIIEKTFAGSIKPIANDIEYTKTVNNDAHFSLWINSDMFFQQYQSYFTGSMYKFTKYAKQDYNTDTTAGMKSAMNVYFQKDKIKIDQKSFTANKEIEALGNAVMNSKQNTALLGIVNPDNLGYLSMSINSEAMMNYYYVLIKKYVAGNNYMSEYSDVANMYVDFLQILIDEKGLADLMPGNYMFVMHNMDTKMVDYIDYTYDSEYKSKQVTKSKKELSPSFSFAMDTRKEDFMKRMAALPVKYANKGGFNYSEKAGYYELAFDSLKYPISSLYFMVKDGKGIVTTSKEVINNLLANKNYSTDDATKNSILNNNYSVKIDMKKVFQITNEQFKSEDSKKLTTYMKDNMGTLTTEMGNKNGMLQGTTILNITGNHTNSLEFLFDMVEKLNTEKRMGTGEIEIKKD